MPRLILHIGTHKTATTSIQRFLFKNRAALEKRGVFYPAYDLIGRSPHYAQLGMVNALSGRHKNYSVEAAEKFFNKVRERSVDFDTTIISAEPFYRHVLNDPRDGHAYPPEEYWPRRHAYIEKIRDLMGEAQVVVVFRGQANYAQSLYQEHVKVTSYKGNFQTFLIDFWYHFVFHEQAQAWNAAFPDLMAMSFEKLIQAGDIVAEFNRLLGIPVDGLEPVSRANEGMPVDLVILKRTLHLKKTNRDELRSMLEKLESRLPGEMSSLLKARSFFASESQMHSFQDQFAEQNEYLRPFLAHKIPHNEAIFATPIKDGQKYGDRVKAEVLHEILKLAVR
ncbi:hypothetical protein Q4578_20485 [Shimia thalassica]|nr:hypothetical protein [Shimia thalassica]MDO6523972.1 hypothetical protein [Shimia thalassica]